MSASPYLVYLSQAQNQTLADIAEYLEKEQPPGQPRATVAVEGRAVMVRFGSWKVRVTEDRYVTVKEEAAELAARVDDEEKRACLTRSTRRLEVMPDDDPEDAHYNDGLTTFERLAALPGAVGLDPYSGDIS